MSDAGVVGQVTLLGDAAGGRDGAYLVVGRAADGSGCSFSFDGTEYTAVAWSNEAANGQIFQFSVTVPATAIPSADGTTPPTSGRVAFDFRSESGVGTLYVGDASQANSGQSSISVVRAGQSLTFAFTGSTWVNATFVGGMVCANGGFAGP